MSTVNLIWNWNKLVEMLKNKKRRSQYYNTEDG